MVALQEAVPSGDFDALNAFNMMNGMEVNERMETNCSNACSTLLHVAAENGDLPRVRALLRAGASAMLQDLWGYTPTHLAAQEGHNAVLQALIARFPDTAHVLDEADRSPLHGAAQAGHTTCVTTLLQAGASATGLPPAAAAADDPADAVDPAAAADCLPARSALHLAAGAGQAACLRILLAGERSRELANLVDAFGRSPLHIAVEENQLACMSVLLQAGADVRSTSRWGATPLHVATRRGFLRAAALLLAAGAVVNAASCCGATPLHEASRGGHVATAQLLLASGAAVDGPPAAAVEAAARAGHACPTPLALAIAADCAEVAEVLVQAGASLRCLQSVAASADVMAVVKGFVRQRACCVVGALKAFALRGEATGRSLMLNIDTNACVLCKVFDVDEPFLRLLLNTSAGAP